MGKLGNGKFLSLTQSKLVEKKKTKKLVNQINIQITRMENPKVIRNHFPGKCAVRKKKNGWKKISY